MSIDPSSSSRSAGGEVGHPPAMLTRLRRPRETAIFWLTTILECFLHERGSLGEWAAGEQDALDNSAEECGTSCLARKTVSCNYYCGSPRIAM